MTKKKDPAMGNLGYDRIDDDFYPTPPWMMDAAIPQLIKHNVIEVGNTIWEPACGEGHMCKVFQAKGFHTVCTDLVDRGYGISGLDFLKTNEIPDGVTSIITNPPYNLALEFVEHSLDLMSSVNGSVAMVLRNEWDSALTRRHLFYRNHFFKMKLVYTSRPKWVVGSTGSPRHNFALFVWDFKNSSYPILEYAHRNEEHR